MTVYAALRLSSGSSPIAYCRCVSLEQPHFSRKWMAGWEEANFSRFSVLDAARWIRIEWVVGEVASIRDKVLLLMPVTGILKYLLRVFLPFISPTICFQKHLRL